MLTVRPIAENDIVRCAEIYNYYIENTTITFEEQPLSVEVFAARVRRIEASYPYLVAEEDGIVVGYAYLDAYNERSAYRYTADLSIYLAHDRLSRGVGGKLLDKIERDGAARGLRNVISIVTEENTRSIAFHEKHGFTEVGRMRKVFVPASISTKLSSRRSTPFSVSTLTDFAKFSAVTVTVSPSTDTESFG